MKAGFVARETGKSRPPFPPSSSRKRVAGKTHFITPVSDLYDTETPISRVFIPS